MASSWFIVSLIRGARRLVVDFLQIEAAELVLRAMEEHAEIVAVDVHLGADVVLRPFVDEDGAQDSRVFLGQMIEHVADDLRGLGRDERAFEVKITLDALGVVVAERLDAQAVAPLLVQDVVADGVDERAEALRAFDPLGRAEGPENAEKRLLDDLVDDGAAFAARAKLDREKAAEVGGEMLLHCRIAGAEAPQVLRVEWEELHEPPPRKQTADLAGLLVCAADYGVRGPSNSIPTNFAQSAGHCCCLS